MSRALHVDHPVRGVRARLAAWAISFVARLLTAARADWQGIDPAEGRQRIYFVNHVSHGDFVLVWSVLPHLQRAATRPVAGADYWRKDALRRFVGDQVFGAVLIDRDPKVRTCDPIARMAEALDTGASLILFPEGTRNSGDAPLLPFKSGIARLAEIRPHVDLVPVWIDNLNRVLPKGALIPVPLMCKVIFGAPLHLNAGEDRQTFLARATDALLSLRPVTEGA